MTDDEKPNTFYCEDCEKFFPSLKGVKMHFKRIHGVQLAIKKKHKEGDEICPLDGEKFVNLNKLSYHFQAKHKMKYVDYLRDIILKEKHKGVWPLCGCGCGQKVPFYKTNFSTYCKGHHHKGKTFSEDAKINMSIGTKKWSDSLTEEQRSEIGKKRVCARDAESYSNADKRYYSTQEYHDKMSISVTEALADSEVKKRMIEGQRRWLIEKGPNCLEQIVLNVLESIVGKENIVFQFLIEGINHKYDFGIEKHNLIVEAYGSYWHGDLLVYSKEQLAQWQNVNRAIGKKYEEMAKNKGYKVVVIWENKKDDIEFIRNKIIEAIESRK